MWIMILGPTGTGKHLVADWLKTDNFEVLEERPQKTFQNPFLHEIDYATRRLDTQMRAASMMNRKNIVTFRSFWDSIEIFLPSMKSGEGYSDNESSMLEMFVQSLYVPGILTPPSVVIYTKTDKMSAFNRAALNSKTIDQDHFNEQVSRYEEYVPKIAVPLIELKMDDKIEMVRKNLEYGIASIRASNLTSQSVWSRDFFR